MADDQKVMTSHQSLMIDDQKVMTVLSV